MPVYTFQVSMPQSTILPRDAVVNTFHMNRTAGIPLGPDLDTLATDVCTMYQARYGSTTAEVRCRIYNLNGGPPLANKVKSLGNVWPGDRVPREVALCLSFAGANKGIPSQRGRLYLSPGMKIGGTPFSWGERPDTAQRDWALDFYRVANASFPDLGGADWQFGVYSPSTGNFTQTTQAWVDDEWDTVRSRGAKPTTRSSVTRDG